ncbi:MAG: UDP-N-acetylmuramoyl-tripeptide--D-alanyl-D-alanine ligase [Candidatus Omnitrophica bacterium]|nr:UDP-N-acetylmuramoyl-tripeptide--D-alanyl-D-alanine ligase [Candidatus Omnitrophota bacterium]
MFEKNELLKAAHGKIIYPGRQAGIKAISTDSRTIKPGEAFAAIRGDNFNGHDFIPQAVKNGASCLIIESAFKGKLAAVKGLKEKNVAVLEVKDTIKALGAIANYQRNKFSIPMVGVTGSNGKTTCKDMIAWLLSARYNVLKNEGTKNNHIGLPMALLGLDSRHEIAVLEIGTNHFKEVSCLTEICRPNIGVITNIGPSHLEHFKDLNGVLKEKYSLLEDLASPGIGLLNSDDPLLRKKINRNTKKPFVLSFGANGESDFRASRIEHNGDAVNFLINKKYKFTLRTLGYYNVYNALAAVAVGRIFGMGYKEIALRLSTFSFPQGRLQFKIIERIKFIDDTYNSNPLSLKQALSALDKCGAEGRKIFVMGDMLELGKQKEGYHGCAGKEASKVCDVLITVGKLSRLAAESAKANGFDVNKIFACDSTQEAKEILFNAVSPKEEDVILVKGSRSMRMEEILK